MKNTLQLGILIAILLCAGLLGYQTVTHNREAKAAKQAAWVICKDAQWDHMMSHQFDKPIAPEDDSAYAERNITRACGAPEGGR